MIDLTYFLIHIGKNNYKHTDSLKSKNFFCKLKQADFQKSIEKVI